MEVSMNEQKKGGVGEEELIAMVEADMVKNQLLNNLKVWMIMGGLVGFLYYVAKGIPAIDRYVSTFFGVK